MKWFADAELVVEGRGYGGDGPTGIVSLKVLERKWCPSAQAVNFRGTEV